MEGKEELLQAVSKKIEEGTKEVAEKTAKVVEVAEKNATSISKLAEAVEENKEEMKSLKASKVSGEKQEFNTFKDKAEEIKAFKNRERQKVEFVVKADVEFGDVTHTGQLDQVSTRVNDIVKKQVTIYDLFEKVPLSAESYSYPVQTSVVRDAKGVALCSKSFSSLTKEEIGMERKSYVKLKDTIDVCRDFVEDYPFMVNRARTLLNDSISFKRDTELLLGTDTATSTNSIDAVASEFDANNVDAPIGATIQDANYVDLILGSATQMKVLGKLSNFRANLVLVDEMDWFKFVESKKDANNNYLDNRVVAVGDGSFVINNLRVLPHVDVPANSFYIMDSTKGYILDRKDITLELSNENGTNFVDEFTTMMVTTKLQFIVELNHANAFMKCSDVATALTAITAP